MITKMTPAQAIESYVKLRNKKAELENSIKDKISKVEGLMTKLEHFLMEECSSQGVDSFKTEYGTAFIKETDYASVDDWDAMIAFVAENNAYEFLTKKVSKSAVVEFIEAHKMPPPGVSYGKRMDIQVRVPSASKNKS